VVEGGVDKLAHFQMVGCFENQAHIFLVGVLRHAPQGVHCYCRAFSDILLGDIAVDSHRDSDKRRAQLAGKVDRRPGFRNG
jgi:hypothetical protein